MCLGSRQEVTNDVGRINSGPYTLYKWSPHDKPRQAQRGGGGTAPSHSQTGRPTRGVWTAQNMSPPLGFDPRTVQPVASRLYITVHLGILLSDNHG